MLVSHSSTNLRAGAFRFRKQHLLHFRVKEGHARQLLRGRLDEVSRAEAMSIHGIGVAHVLKSCVSIPSSRASATPQVATNSPRTRSLNWVSFSRTKTRMPFLAIDAANADAARPPPTVTISKEREIMANALLQRVFDSRCFRRKAPLSNVMLPEGRESRKDGLIARRAFA